MRTVRLSAEPSLDAAVYPFTHRIRVRFAETDAMGIVHHSRYLPYLEETRVAYLRHLGHPYAEMRAEGIDYAVLECFVQYRQPLRFDDEVDVHLLPGLGIADVVPDGVPAHRRRRRRATAVTVHGCVTLRAADRLPPGWQWPVATVLDNP